MGKVIQIQSQPGNEWEEQLGVPGARRSAGCSVPRAWTPSGWAPASPTAERPGALRPCPRPFTDSGLIMWVSRLSGAYLLIHNSPPRSATPHQRPRAGNLAEAGSRGPGAALSSHRPGLGAVTPRRPPLQQAALLGGLDSAATRAGAGDSGSKPLVTSLPTTTAAGTPLLGPARGAAVWPVSRLGARAARTDGSRPNSTLVPTLVGCTPRPLPGSWVYVLWDLLGGNPTTKR